MSVFFPMKILLGFFPQHSRLLSVCFLSTNEISQDTIRSLFETLLGYGKPFHSCYINDSKHKRKAECNTYSLRFKSFIPNFQIKLVWNPHSAATYLIEVCISLTRKICKCLSIHWLKIIYRILNSFLYSWLAEAHNS